MENAKKEKKENWGKISPKHILGSHPNTGETLQLKQQIYLEINLNLKIKKFNSNLSDMHSAIRENCDSCQSIIKMLNLYIII